MKTEFFTEKTAKLAKAFHKDERGDVVQNLLILLMAVVILVAISAIVFPNLLQNVRDKMDEYFTNTTQGQ